MCLFLQIRPVTMTTRVQYSISVLRHFANNVTDLLDRNVLSACRQSGLIKRKTVREVREGRKVRDCKQCANSQGVSIVEH